MFYRAYKNKIARSSNRCQARAHAQLFSTSLLKSRLKGALTGERFSFALQLSPFVAPSILLIVTSTPR